MSPTLDDPFDFSDPAAPLIPARSSLAAVPAIPSAADSPAGPGRSFEVPPSPVARRGRTISRTALAVVVLTALALGVGIYQLLAGINLFSAADTNNALAWGLLVLLGLAGGVVGFVLAIIAAVRSRLWWMATVALVASLLLPAIAFGTSVKLGTDSLRAEIAKTLDGGKDATVESVGEWAASHDVDLGFFTRWLVEKD